MMSSNLNTGHFCLRWTAWDGKTTLSNSGLIIVFFMSLNLISEHFFVLGGQPGMVNQHIKFSPEIVKQFLDGKFRHTDSIILYWVPWKRFTCCNFFVWLSYYCMIFLRFYYCMLFICLPGKTTLSNWSSSPLFLKLWNNFFGTESQTVDSIQLSWVYLS